MDLAATEDKMYPHLDHVYESIRHLIVREGLHGFSVALSAVLKDLERAASTERETRILNGARVCADDAVAMLEEAAANVIDGSVA